MSRPVLTIGTFDVPHAGHAAFLRKCAEYGEVTVGISDDDFVRKYKGEPVYNERDRKSLVSEMGYKTRYSYDCGKDLIASFNSGRDYILAVSTDWLYPKDYLKQVGITAGDLQARRIDLVFIPHTPGISTTDIKARLTNKGCTCVQDRSAGWAGSPCFFDCRCGGGYHDGTPVEPEMRWVLQP